MKEIYEKPSLEVFAIEEDILTVSGTNGDYYVKDIWEDLDE